MSGGEIMRQLKRQSGFVLSVLLTLLFNLEWTIPAWIFLALHFVCGLSLWCFYISLGLWVLMIMGKSILLRLLNKAGQYKDPPKENKNPYSSGGYKKGGSNNEEN